MDFEKNEQENLKFINWINEVKEKNDDYFETVKKIMPVFADFAKNCAHKKTIFELMGSGAFL